MAWYALERRDFGSVLIDQLESYWRRKAEDRPMPSRSDIDPVEIVPLLPYVVLTSIEREPFRVRYRLVGTQVVAQAGRDVTGCYLDQLDMHADAVDVEAVHKAVAETARPAFGVSRLPSVASGAMGFYFAVFPLSNDGRTVTHAISVEDYRNVAELRETGGSPG